MSLNLNRLNSRQRDAVLHGGGPLLILAGAGSGKTSTMAYRIAHLIAVRYQPGSAVLGLSFTRKAAMELRERVKKLVTESVGKSATRGLTITTFHSLCVQILRTHAHRIGYQADFTIFDQNDQEDLVRQILRNIKLDDRKFDPRSLLFEIGQAKNRFLTVEQAEEHFLNARSLPQDYQIAATTVYAKYQEQLQMLNAMDFDDLLFNAVRCLSEHEEVRAHYKARFQHILVDEYQDTNPAQFKLLELLLGDHRNICVVGDDDQSIYAWRGADSQHILGFDRHFTGARVITLDQNYRSTSIILDAANEVIGRNKNRHPKQLWSERGAGDPIQLTIVEEDRAEADMVAEEILRRAQSAVEGQVKQLRPWKDFAILYRSNPQSRLFEEALRMRKIPYKLVGALSYLDRKEIKDVLSYWRLIVNPKDDASARRVLNWPARGIGKGAFEAAHQAAVAKGGAFYDALPDMATLYPRAAGGTRQFLDLLQSLRMSLSGIALKPDALAQWGRQSLEWIGVKKALEDENEDPVQWSKKWDNAEELANSLGQLNVDEILEAERERNTPRVDGITLLREYVARVTLNAMDEEEDRGDKKEKDKDQVTLLTLHGSKGLEYPVVFLVGMEDGLLPHQRSIDEGSDLSEERRLAYVGITRARDQLILSRARFRVRYGKKVPRVPSRFLDEMPNAQILRQDISLTPDTSTPEAKEVHETKVKDFLASIRASLGEKKRPGTSP